MDKFFTKIKKLSSIFGVTKKQRKLTVLSVRQHSASAAAKFLDTKRKGSVYISTLTAALSAKFSRCAAKLSSIFGVTKKQRKLTVLSEVGETIVEVMMATAIMALVIVTSFVIVRRSLNLGQQAKERTLALKIVESQLERLKYLATQSGHDLGSGIFGQTGNYCVGVLPDGSMEVVMDTADSSCDHGSFPDSALTVSIHYDADGPDATTDYDDDTFTIIASWDSITGDGKRDNVTINYRLHPAAKPSISSPLTPPPAQCGSQFNFDFTAAKVKVGTGLDGSSTQPNNDPYFTSGLNVAESSPDFDLRSLTSSAGLPLSGGAVAAGSGCGYEITAITYCTERIYAATFCYGDGQRNERARIEFYEDFVPAPTTENPTHGQCDFSKGRVAYFDTEEVPNPEKFNSSTGALRLMTTRAELKLDRPSEDLTVGCIHLRHICLTISKTAVFPTPDEPHEDLNKCWNAAGNVRESSSMYVHEITFKPV